MNDKLDIAAIRARAEAASKGEWRWGQGPSEVLCYDGIVTDSGNPVFVNCGRGSGDPSEADIKFITKSKTDVPALCDEVERLLSVEQERDLLRESIATALRHMKRVPHLEEHQAAMTDAVSILYTALAGAADAKEAGDV